MSKLDDIIAQHRQDERALISDVRERQRHFETAQRKLELHQAKLQGLLEAKQLTDADHPPQMRPLAPVRKRTRALSTHWKQIMMVIHMETGHAGFSYDDLDQAARRVGHVASRDTLRSQMSLYKGGGLVEALDDGNFRLTSAGLKAAGIEAEDMGSEAPNENEAPNGSAAGASETRGWSVTSTPSAPSNPVPWHRA